MLHLLPGRPLSWTAVSIGSASGIDRSAVTNLRLPKSDAGAAICSMYVTIAFPVDDVMEISFFAAAGGWVWAD
jgi:hypothetical protein